VNAYSLLQAEIVELFQLDLQMLLQQTFLGLEFTVSDQLQFRLLHTYTHTQWVSAHLDSSYKRTMVSKAESEAHGSNLLREK